MSFTVADVKRSYTPEKARSEMLGELPSYLLYRPLSFYITPLFLKARVPVLAVPALSFCLALSLPWLAWFGGAHAYAWVAGLAVVIHLLDCVDGNMARTLGQVSRLGALADAFADAIYWAALFLSIGLLAAKEGAPHGVALALGCSILTLLNRFLRDNFALLFQSRAVYTPGAAGLRGPRDWFLATASGLEYLYPLALGLAGALSSVPLFLTAVAAHVGAVFIGAMAWTFVAAKNAQK